MPLAARLPIPARLISDVWFLVIGVAGLPAKFTADSKADRARTDFSPSN